MKTFLILFRMEFRRFWTPIMIVTAFGVTAFGDMIVVGLSSMKPLSKLSVIFEMSYGVMMFPAVLIFSAGMIGGDVKNGWLRTLLIRAVTRQQFVMAKFSVVVLATWLTMVLTAAVAVGYHYIAAVQPPQADASAVFIFLLFRTGEMVLLVTISSFLSCRITGAYNSLALFVWLSGAQMIELYLSRNYSHIPWVVIAKDFLSPSGFTNAVQMVKTGGAFPAAELLWGLSSMMFFMALTLYFVNSLEVDNGSE